MAPCRGRKWGVQSTIWISSSSSRERGRGQGDGRRRPLHPWGFLPARDANASQAATCPGCLTFFSGNVGVEMNHVLGRLHSLSRTCVLTDVPGAAHPRCFACLGVHRLCPASVTLRLGAPAHAHAQRSRDGAPSPQGQPCPRGRYPHVKTPRVLPRGSADPGEQEDSACPRRATSSVFTPSPCSRVLLAEHAADTHRANPAWPQRLGERGDQQERSTPVVACQ